jgi:Holliday junction resolvase RusA-like endonuclease
VGDQASPVFEGNWLQPEWVRAGDVASFSFVAVGTAKPKARPRVVKNARTGFTHTFTPDATVNWEQAVAWQAKQALTHVAVNFPDDIDLFPCTGRVIASLRFNVVRPKTLPKKVQYPLKGADVDNLAKSVLDALQNVQVIGDDKTVSDLQVCKRFVEPGHPEGVEIDLTLWFNN